jgi:hypothetical protein
MDSPQQSDFTSVSGLAKPLKLQQLEQAVNLEPYLDFVEDIFNTPIRYVISLIFFLLITYFTSRLDFFFVCLFVVLYLDKAVHFYLLICSNNNNIINILIIIIILLIIG